MRYLVVTHAGGSPYHGPNTRWYYLFRAFLDSEQPVEANIVSSSNFHKYLKPPLISEGYDAQLIDGIRYHWIKTKPYKKRGIGQIWNQFQFVFGCWKFRHKIEKIRPDVIIASSPHPFVVFPAYHLSRALSVPLIYEVRDLWPQVLIELGGYSRWHPYIYLLGLAEKFAVRHSQLIFSVKPGDFEYFCDHYGLDNSKFRYLPNGFFPIAEDVTAPDRSFQYLRDKYKFLIVYVGAVSAYYQLDKLILLADMLSDHPEIGVVVMGSGDYSNALEQAAKEKMLRNFYLLGPIPKSKVMAVLKNADACYVGLADLPVNRYGISCNKIYEYMFAGKPIIGHYKVGYDPVRAAGCGVTAASGDERLLVKEILKWLRDPALARSLGNRGKEYFDQHHNFKEVVKKLQKYVAQIT